MLWHRNIKPIKGDGHEEIDTDEIARLDRAIRAKCVDCGTIGQFRQHAARCERGGNVVGDGLLSCEISWTLARNDRGELFIRQLVMLRDRPVGVDFLAGMEMGAGHKDRDLAGGLRHVRLPGDRLDQVPNRLANTRRVQPRVPWPHQGTIFSYGGEAMKAPADPIAHVFIEGALLRRQIGWWYERKTHDNRSDG
jgi:hypothetical protein